MDIILRLPAHIERAEYPDNWFGGVVGYRICLTHRRSPVRARAESFYYSLTTFGPRTRMEVSPDGRRRWMGLASNRATCASPGSPAPPTGSVCFSGLNTLA